MGKGPCSRERRAAKLNLDAPQGTYLKYMTIFVDCLTDGSIEPGVKIR